MIHTFYRAFCSVRPYALDMLIRHHLSIVSEDFSNKIQRFLRFILPTILLPFSCGMGACPFCFYHLPFLLFETVRHLGMHDTTGRPPGQRKPWNIIKQHMCVFYIFYCIEDSSSVLKNLNNVQRLDKKFVTHFM